MLMKQTKLRMLVETTLIIKLRQNPKVMVIKQTNLEIMVQMSLAKLQKLSPVMLQELSPRPPAHRVRMAIQDKPMRPQPVITLTLMAKRRPVIRRRQVTPLAKAGTETSLGKTPT